MTDLAAYDEARRNASWLYIGQFVLAAAIFVIAICDFLHHLVALTLTNIVLAGVLVAAHVSWTLYLRALTRRKA